MSPRRITWCDSCCARFVKSCSSEAKQNFFRTHLDSPHSLLVEPKLVNPAADGLCTTDLLLGHVVAPVRWSHHRAARRRVCGVAAATASRRAVAAGYASRALCAETHEARLEDNRYINMDVLKEQRKAAMKIAV